MTADPFADLPIEVRARSGALTGKSLTIREVAKLHFPTDLACELAWKLKLIDEFTERIAWRKYQDGAPLVIGPKEYYPVSPKLYEGFLRETNTSIPELITLWLGLPTPRAIGRREQQWNAFLVEIQRLGWDTQAIPYGGKQCLNDACCKARPDL